MTPFWFGLHDGTFDTFNLGEPASSAVEIVAEEGFIGLEGLDPDYPSYVGTPFEGVDLANSPILPATIAGQFASSPAGERGLQGFPWTGVGPGNQKKVPRARSVDL